MKTIKRELNPDIIDKLKENFVADGVYSKDVMCRDFVDYMTNSPDNICVMVGYDDEKIVGHLVAFKPFNRDYVVLDQAWNISTPEHAKAGFEQLREWVKSIDCKEIRFETERASVITRACITWGFKGHSVILQMRIQND